MLSSIRPIGDLYTRPVAFVPSTVTLDNYRDLFNLTNIPRHFVNTLAVGTVACLIGVIVALLGVYGLSRFRFMGMNKFAIGMLVVYMIPNALLVIPMFRIWFNVGLLNSLIALAITYLIITLPFSVWLLRPYLETIPKDLEEAAMVDGCTRFQAFRKIIVPQALPGIAATFIFTFVVVWNELIIALVLIRDEEKRTISLGIASLFEELLGTPWGLLNAAGTLATLPIVVVFILLQKQLMRSLTAGGVKG